MHRSYSCQDVRDCKLQARWVHALSKNVADRLYSTRSPSLVVGCGCCKSKPEHIPGIRHGTARKVYEGVQESIPSKRPAHRQLCPASWRSRPFTNKRSKVKSQNSREMRKREAEPGRSLGVLELCFAHQRPNIKRRKKGRGEPNQQTFQERAQTHQIATKSKRIKEKSRLQMTVDVPAC